MGIGVFGDSTSTTRRRRWTVWARRALLAAATIVVVVVVGEEFARTTEDHPGYGAASDTAEGVAEATVLERAGHPSRLIQPATGDCAEHGGKRQLVYERASRGFGGWGRRAVDAQIVVCVAGDGRVVETSYINF
jgi:hypothetical protein